MVDRSINRRRQVCRVIWDKSLSVPASVYTATKPVWICCYSAQKSFSLQEHHTWCRGPKGSPAFAQPIPQEQEGWCQIQTLSELEGELILRTFSDLHIKPQENISISLVTAACPSAMLTSPATRQNIFQIWLQMPRV